MYLGLLLFIFSSPLLNQATTLYHPEYTESTHLLYKSHIPWIKVYPGKTVSKEIEEAVAVPEEVTGLKEFVALVFTGEANVIRGVFVPDSVYPIIQQPSGNNIYVSTKSDLVTQFRLADQNGVTGLPKLFIRPIFL